MNSAPDILNVIPARFWSLQSCWYKDDGY